MSKAQITPNDVADATAVCSRDSLKLSRKMSSMSLKSSESQDSTKGVHASTDNDTGGMTEVQLLRTYLSEQYKNFYDLAMRTAYYMGLNDDELQRELSKSPEEEHSLQKFYEESYAAKSRTKHFKDNSSAHRDKELPNDSRDHQNYAVNRQETGSQNHSNEKNNKSGTKSKRKRAECNNCHIKGHNAQNCRKPGGGRYQSNSDNDKGAEASRVEISSVKNGLSDSNYSYIRKIQVTPNDVVNATAVCSQDPLKSRYSKDMHQVKTSVSVVQGIRKSRDFTKLM